MQPALRHVAGRVVRAAAVAPGAARYLRDRAAYSRLPGGDGLRWRDSFPKLTDRLSSSPFDPHYFHQDTWAAQRIVERSPARHVDVGSRVDFVGFLTAVTTVTFVDIRPLEVEIEGLTAITGNLLDMPFADASLESVSCLHVAEHVGLGRYGDPLDPLGTRKAAAELQRVLAPGGQLLFSVPVGRPRVEFNAHRVHDPREVAGWFEGCELREFAGVDDANVFRRHRSPDELAGATYACGIYQLIASP